MLGAKPTHVFGSGSCLLKTVVLCDLELQPPTFVSFHLIQPGLSFICVSACHTGYGLEVDMWAAGVILYILLCGFPPFRSPERDQDELFNIIQLGHFEFLAPYWDNISDGEMGFPTLETRG